MSGAEFRFNGKSSHRNGLVIIIEVRHHIGVIRSLSGQFCLLAVCLHPGHGSSSVNHLGIAYLALMLFVLDLIFL